MMTTPIHKFLSEYSQRDSLRLHMPGHKGEYPHDITEIFGADSLFDSYTSGGIIAQSEENATKLFGSLKTIYSCGGSTLAIQTMLAILKSASNKGRISVSRYAHKSVVSAALLLGFEIDWIYPAKYLSADISPNQIAQSINPDTAGIFITSIDYYGGIAGVKIIRQGFPHLPILVDNAHGGYLKFANLAHIPHPNEFADLVCDSAHKTLPVLTGGGYLHINKPDFLPRGKELMGVFASTSPSYLILESLDLCNEFLANNSHKIPQLCDEILAVKSRLKAYGYVVLDSDPMRITIDTRSYGYSGEEFADCMRKLGGECEFSDSNFAVLLFSVVTTGEELEKTFNLLTAIPQKKPMDKKIYPVLTPERQLPMKEALFEKSAVIPVDKAFGRICGEIYAPCPPGVPLIMPGEIVDFDVINALKLYNVTNIRILI